MATVSITLTNGQFLADLHDGGVNTADTSLSLLGMGAFGYTKTHAQNFVYLLENFSDVSPPAHPLVGQLWYNPQTRVFQVFKGVDWESADNLSEPAGAVTAFYMKSPSHLWRVEIDDTGVLHTTRAD